MYGETHVHSAVCEGTSCASIYLYIEHGSLMAAVVPSGNPTASCVQHAYPVANGCW
jgi:hypothetical protein